MPNQFAKELLDLASSIASVEKDSQIKARESGEALRWLSKGLKNLRNQFQTPHSESDRIVLIELVSEKPTSLDQLKLKRLGEALGINFAWNTKQHTERWGPPDNAEIHYMVIGYGILIRLLEISPD